MGILGDIIELQQGGKMETLLKHPLATKDDFAKVYTPGVAQVCEEIARNQHKAYERMAKSNTVAVVSEGTLVVGCGAIHFSGGGDASYAG
ncbi:hypothetical protein [Paenibacillus campi]|uniref:hypothetical protein n=1 Tax=Paenibacillus campi TaxID=3106031 RepID=UPI002AFF7BF5|nr:hypothetical protein [Paenibacillus sp. SGZ-1014]